MQNFIANLPHLIMAVIVISAAVVLGAIGTITGAESVTLIAAAAGFSLGAGAASASVAAVAPTVSVTSTSTGGQTATVAPTLESTSPPGHPAP